MKHFTLKSRILVGFLALSILVSSCASTTMIDSYPSGAKLYLDGEMVGQTPYSMTDTKPMFTCTSVRIEKENYSPFYTNICRDEEADAGAIIGGVFFWIPFLWSFKYKPTHFYELRANGEKEKTLDQVIKEEEKKTEE